MSDKIRMVFRKPLKPPVDSTETLKYICCGKLKCKTCRGKRYHHGPYVYAHVNRPNGVGKWTWYVRRPTAEEVSDFKRKMLS